jgi:hypothetical protein
VSAADLLRDAALPAALTAGADALDRVTALEATVAGLEISLADARARLAACEGDGEVRWGTTAERRGREALPDAWRRIRAAVGPVTAMRLYDQPEDGIRWPIVEQLGARGDEVLTADMAGVSLLYSCRPSLVDVAAGKHDAALRAWGRAAVARYEATGQPSTFTLMHEADVKIRQGQLKAATYRAGADRAHEVLAEYPAAAVLCCPIFTRYLLDAGTGPSLADLLPERSRMIGFDVYKFGPRTAIPGMLDPVRAAATEHDLPFGIFETGVDGRTHTAEEKRKALTALAFNLATGTPRPWCVAYFNSSPGSSSDWPIDGDTQAVGAWRLGQSAAAL